MKNEAAWRPAVCIKECGCLEEGRRGVVFEGIASAGINVHNMKSL